METAFSWLGQIFDALLQFVPRRVIVRATEGGVKWSLWREPREIKPGVRIYWPLISDVEILVTARQSINTRTQSLMTKDGKTVVAGGVVVYKISDVVQAIGKNNWNPEETCADIAQAAIVDVIASWNLNGVYVSRAALTDFSIVKQLNHSGISFGG